MSLLLSLSIGNINSCLCVLGYRYFKSTMFATGFLFGSLVTYLICLEENFLPLEGKIGVAVGSGILCGLITMLVQYVGLFMTGFHLGLLMAVAGLIVTEWFVHPQTKWVPIGAVLGTGLTCALLCLRFQRAVTFLSTSILGSAMMSVGVDYFVGHFQVLFYSLDRLKAVRSPSMCWFAWLVLALWPLASVLGCVAQCHLTGRKCDHREGRKCSRVFIDDPSTILIISIWDWGADFNFGVELCASFSFLNLEEFYCIKYINTTH